MNTRDNKITVAGALGEKILFEYLEETGSYEKLEYSDNKYDMHKDIVGHNGESSDLIEQKLRTVIRKYHAFPLERSQWYKADNADRLFFISNPTAVTESIKIYEATKDSFFVVEKFGPRKAETRMYDLNKMKLCKVIKDKQMIEKLYNLSVSTYKQ